MPEEVHRKLFSTLKMPLVFFFFSFLKCLWSFNHYLVNALKYPSIKIESLYSNIMKIAGSMAEQLAFNNRMQLFGDNSKNITTE